MCIHTEEEKSVIAPNPTVMDLLRRWLASEQDLYKRLTETRRAIGNKAQGNIAIAGIFVAAVFSWIKDLVQVKVSLSETGTVGLLRNYRVRPLFIPPLPPRRRDPVSLQVRKIRLPVERAPAVAPRLAGRHLYRAGNLADWAGQGGLSI